MLFFHLFIELSYWINTIQIWKASVLLDKGNQNKDGDPYMGIVQSENIFSDFEVLGHADIT